MSEPVYTPNSHKYKEEQKNAAPEEKRVQKVVKGAVKTKTNEVRKFADIFISEDITSVKNYIFMDVLVPAIKKAIYDIVTNGIDMFLYGGTGKGKSSSPSGAKVSYRNFYEQKNSTSGYRGSESSKNQSGFDYDDLEFENRGDAEAVIGQMQGAIGRYGFVTVADLYDMVDLPTPYTSQKYGWMDVSSAEVIRFRGKYRLRLPRAVPID
jgi:hypothetical protein